MDVVNLIQENPIAFWGGLGVLLLVVEVFTLTSVALVLGSGALTLCVLILVTGWPESVVMQFVLLTAISLIEYWPMKIAMENAKKNWPKTTGDIQDQLAGAPDGIVKENGYVLLDRAFLGNREWSYETDDELSVGDRVSIKEISGNKLRIIKRENV